MRPKPRKFEGTRPDNHKIINILVVTDAAIDGGGHIIWRGTHVPGSDPWYLLSIKEDHDLTLRDLYANDNINLGSVGNDPWLVDGWVLTNGDEWYKISNLGTRINLYKEDQEAICQAITNEHQHG